MAIENSEIKELAEAPKKVVGEEGSVEERNIEEVIAAKRHIDQSSAGSAPYGIRISRMKSMGTVQ